MALSYPRITRVLVVAPHPDDDAIGCGGIIVQLAARGVRVAVTYVTDGSASHLKSLRYPPAALRVVREGEARASLRRLGIRRRPQFLRAPDGGLADLGAAERDALADALARRIATLRAAAVFAPWPRDPHPDHIATAALVTAALARCGRNPTLLYYRVWQPVRGGPHEEPRPGEVTPLDVPLSARDLRRKRAAIMEHRSQTGRLIDDDPEGFRIDDELLAAWLVPVERYYRPRGGQNG